MAIFANPENFYLFREKYWYMPCAKFVLHDVGLEEEEKVFHLHHHSEKLAIALGLINTGIMYES